MRLLTNYYNCRAYYIAHSHMDQLGIWSSTTEIVVLVPHLLIASYNSVDMVFYLPCQECIRGGGKYTHTHAYIE